ncbi:MAG: hypothetical protein ACREHV_08025, partial [Rhizomicrobium sp.]
SWATAIAGRTYVVSPNPLGLQTIRLSLTAPGAAWVRLGFADGTSGDHPVGMDGIPRLSFDIASGHRVALLGKWGNRAFVLDYDEIARIDDYRLSLSAVRGGLSIRLTERTGLVDMTLTATPG